MDSSRLRSILSRFDDMALLVVGDYFLDKYLHIDPALAEESLETGLEAFQVTDIRHSPGAAGTVMSNLSALGVGRLYALGVIGPDGQGFELKEDLKARRANIVFLLEAEGRFTPTYTKPMKLMPGGGRAEMNRIDIKNRTPTPPDLEDKVIQALQECVPHVQGVIIADQVQEENCGVITERVRESLSRLAREHPDIVFFADSRVRIGRFRDVSVKPNRSEAAQAVLPGHTGPISPSEVEECGRRLFERCGKPAFVTLGPEGILVFDRQGIARAPGVRVEGEID
ncbi:MAG: carbohydrate kinase, partial [Armatimonadetes bacterium]|nr:carbohydrate kinase [Armatimonadota bacterium]